MIPKKIYWLLIIASISLILTTDGKNNYPALFGAPYIVWSLDAIESITISLGLFLSVYTFFTNPEIRKMIGGMVILFLFLWSFLSGTYLSVALISKMSVDAMQSTSYQSFKDKIAEKLYQSDTSSEKSKKFAGYYYQFSGIKLPYKVDEQSYTLLEPTDDQREKWGEMNQADQEIDKSVKILNSCIKQNFCLLAFHLSCFFMVFFFGFLYLIFKVPQISSLQSANREL